MVSDGIALNERTAATAVVLLVAVLYARTLGFEFVFDDRSLISAHGPEPLGGMLPYRPLRYLSYALDDLLGSGAAWVYHLTNVVLHAVVCLLVLRIGVVLGLAAASAGFAAALVAVHPLSVEAVAYVAGRRDLLAALFGLSAVYVWIRPRTSVRVCAVALLASVAAKESGLVFVFVCHAAHWAGISRRSASELRTLYLTLAVATLLVLAYGGASALLVDPATSLAAAPRLARHYLSGLLAVRGYSADYPLLASFGAPALRDLAACVLGIGALVVAAVLCRRLERGDFAFLVAWASVVAASIVFVGGLHEPGADRHAYPWLAPAALCLAACVQRALRGAPAGLWSAAVVVTLLMMTLAASSRIVVWRSEAALWRATARSQPASVRAHQNLAALASEVGKRGRARKHLKAVLVMRPKHAPAYLGLAALACAGGNLEAARFRLLQAASYGAGADRTEALRRACQLPPG